MTALTRFFFRSPYIPPSSKAILVWWEARRPAFNLAVGAAGLMSLSAVAVVNALPPAGRPESFPWIGVLVYGVLANLCYCAGPALDMFMVRRWGSAYSAVGPALFRYGFAFAVGLSLLPIPLVAIGWLLRVINAL